MPAPISFDTFVSSLAILDRPERKDEAMRATIARVVADLRQATLTREGLTDFVSTYPSVVPVLATCVDLTQEQLKNQLAHRFGTSSWTLLARKQPSALIAMLEDEFELIQRLTEQLTRQWSFDDVLLERFLWSRKGATSAIGRGRKLENEIQAIVDEMKLPFAMRTRFVGARGQDAPCDLAVPAGGDKAQIVVAMKGFNSTGSKLTDAVREIEDMANVRLPTQFVFAVVDGIGWKSRKADLGRIYALWNNNTINGLYTLAHLDRFEADLSRAAAVLSISAVDTGTEVVIAAGDQTELGI